MRVLCKTKTHIREGVHGVLVYKSHAPGNTRAGQEEDATRIYWK